MNIFFQITIKLSFGNIVVDKITYTHACVRVESSLISGFNEHCEHGMRVKNISYTEPCSLEGSNLKKLGGLQMLKVSFD